MSVLGQTVGRGTPRDRIASIARPAVLVWLVPIGLAAVYLVLFVLRFRHNVAVVNWDSDYASEYVVPETLVRYGTGGHTLLATSGQYVSLWFGLLTARLPLHRQLWEISPTLLFLGTAATIGWSVNRVAGREASAAAVLLAVVVSPWAWFIFIAPGAHNNVYPCTALLGAFLIWLTRGEGRRRSMAFAAPLIAGVALGLCLASDALNIACAIVPFAFAAVLAGVRRSRRSRLVALSALAVVAVSIPVAILTSSAMKSEGFVTVAPTPEKAPLAVVPEHAKILFEGLRLLFNGYLGHLIPNTVDVNTAGKLHAELGVACVLIMGAALLALVAMGAVAAGKLLWSGLRGRPSESPAQLARQLHIVFWVAAGAVPCVTFVLGTRTEYFHTSYYATVVFAVAAVIPLLMSSRSPLRWILPVAASVSFLASIVGLGRNYMDSNDTVIARYGTAVERIAKANHATTGYAGYRDATSLTWSSHERVTARPVNLCANPAGADICPFFLERVPSWYVPHARRSFLLVDDTEEYIRAIPPGLGRPTAAYNLGEVQLYIYPYDLASRLGPPPT